MLSEPAQRIELEGFVPLDQVVAVLHLSAPHRTGVRVIPDWARLWKALGLRLPFE